MKNILGLDLGITSIGAALTRLLDNGDFKEFLDLKVHYENHENITDYRKGNPLKNCSPKAMRRLKRSLRKRNRNKKQIKSTVTIFLEKLLNVTKTEHTNLPDLKIKALTKRIEKTELLSIIYNYAKYRGYNELDNDMLDLDEKGKSDYKINLIKLSDWCTTNKKTISQYYNEHDNINIHHSNLESQAVVLQDLYKKELNIIWNTQSKYYEELTEENLKLLTEKIYFRKGLKSSRHLKNNCIYESNIENKIYKKVTYKANINFQKFRALDYINYCKLETNKSNYLLDVKSKKEIYEYLHDNKEISDKEIISIFNKNNPNINVVKCNYKKIIGITSLVRLKECGITTNFQQCIEDIHSKSISKYNFTEIPKLEKDNCSYSDKALKKIIPYMDGTIDYLESDKAIEKVYPKNNSKTNKEFNIDNLKPINENDIKNPIVTKIINLAIKIIKHNYKKHGIDEIVIELSRELRSSSKKRKYIYDNNIERESINTILKETLKHYNLNYNSKKHIDKLKMWIEQSGINVFNLKDIKEVSNDNIINVNSIKSYCIYSGKIIQFKDVFDTSIIDIEHIVPESRVYDDSFDNKVLSYKTINQNKGNKTGFEFAHDESLSDYSNNIKKFKKINEKKYDNTQYADLRFLKNDEGLDINKKTEFSASALNDTSYMAKFLAQYLKNIGFKVRVSNGVVTSYIRNLNLGDNKHISQALSSIKRYSNDKELEDVDFNKRIDNRHHALDALIVSITKKSYIDSLTKDHKGLINCNNYIKNELMSFFGGMMPVDIIKDINNSLKNTIVIQSKNKYPIFKKTKLVNGKKIIGKGFRGSAHKETFYGKTNGKSTERVKITDIKFSDIFPKIKEDKINKKGEVVKVAITESAIIDKNILNKIINTITPYKHMFLDDKKQLFIFKNGELCVNINLPTIKISHKKIMVNNVEVKISDIKYEDIENIDNENIKLEIENLINPYINAIHMDYPLFIIKKNTIEINTYPIAPLKYKKIKMYSIYGDLYEIDGGKKNVVCGNNFCVNYKKDKNSYKAEKISVMNLIENSNKGIKKDYDFRLHSGDFIVLRHTKEEIEEFNRIKNYKYYDDLFYITEVNDTNIFLRPHYIPKGGKVLYKGVKDSIDSKRYYLCNSLGRYLNDYNNITKVSVGLNGIEPKFTISLVVI